MSVLCPFCLLFAILRCLAGCVLFLSTNKWISDSQQRWGSCSRPKCLGNVVHKRCGAPPLVFRLHWRSARHSCVSIVLGVSIYSEPFLLFSNSSCDHYLSLRSSLWSRARRQRCPGGKARPPRGYLKIRYSPNITYLCDASISTSSPVLFLRIPSASSL